MLLINIHSFFISSVFIRHRTAAEIAEANGVAITELRDPETDADRTKKPEWLVMLGICTHLGCVPIGEAGDYDGRCGSRCCDERS